MSTISFIEKTCYICGATNSYGHGGMITMSSNIGLDGHPGNLTPLFTALNLCPNCGYSAPDIEIGSDVIREIVSSASYKTVMGNSGIPELVRKFVGWAYIQKENKQLCEAARSMLCATWIAEHNIQSDALASSCRHKTLELMAECKAAGGTYEMTVGKELITIIDIYRREGGFDDALEICYRALESTASEEEEFLLRYEEKLCHEKNSTPQTVSDAERNL